MKGGSITPPLLQKILEETYYEDKPLPNIDGYQLDEQLSKLSKISGLMTCLVYVKDKQVYVGIRGTNTETYKVVSAGDWLNNAVLGVSLTAYKQTDRYKKARSTLVQVIKKYKVAEMKIGKGKKQLLKGYIINEMSGGCQCDDKSIRQPKLKGYVIN